MGGELEQKIREWAERFSDYKRPPKSKDIKLWINYFSDKHKSIAYKILDNLILISEEEIQKGYKNVLDNLNGWNSNYRKRKGRWFFCGFGKPHESGPAMMRIFSEATKLSTDVSKKIFFINVTEIVNAELTADDTIVFVDDFAGTGRQAVRIWSVIKELVASEAKTFLLLTAATTQAIKKIENETPLKVSVTHVLNDKNNIFHGSSQLFTEMERAVLLTYCRKADRTIPKGFGDCGLIFVLSHKTPNNSVPILHANHPQWNGILPRYLNA